MRCVYILQSDADPNRHYVGSSSNVESRLNEHNEGKSTHTRKFRPWQIRAVFSFAGIEKAADFEEYLKSGSGRAFLKRHLG
jgi:predicted GIY-YIG superfamily endonuclease